MTITICGYTFKGPFSSADSLLPQSGVYAILATDKTVIDVGESGDVRDRVKNHNRKNCWRNNKRASSPFVAYYTNKAERMKIEKLIRSRRNPPCGKV